MGAADRAAGALAVAAAFPAAVEAVIDLAELLHLDEAGYLEVGDRWTLGATIEGPDRWTAGAWVRATDAAMSGHTHEAVLGLGPLALFVTYDGDQGTDHDDCSHQLLTAQAAS